MPVWLLGLLSKFPGAVDKLLKIAKLLKGGIGGIFGGLSDLYGYLEGLAKEWGEFDDAAKKTARSIGLTREQAEQFRDSIIDAQIELGRLYNTSAKEITDFTEAVSKGYGRVMQLSKQAREDFAAIKMLVETTAIQEMVKNMDAFGASVETSLAYMSLTREQAKKLGLNAAEAADKLSKNVNALSKFGFKEGISDIQQMTLWSQRLKVNFESIAAATKNFNTIQGAIENSAKIQMLGGEMSFNYMNPLEVMSEAMYDTKSFGERIADTVANMGTFDKGTGTVRIESWLDRAKIQHYAEALGMQVEELTNMANQQAKFHEIDSHISRALSEEQRQAVANMAQFNADANRWEIVDALGNRYDVESIQNEGLLKQIAANTVSNDRDTNIKNIAGHVAQIASWSHDEARAMIGFNEQQQGYEKSIQASRAKATQTLGIPSLVDSIHSKVTDIVTNQKVMISLIMGMGALRFIKGFTSAKGVAKPLGKLISNVFKFGKAGFEHGGIIGGNYPTGDQLFARVNSDEMVLTKEQQSQLFQIANGAMPAVVDSYSEPTSGEGSWLNGWFRRGVEQNAVANRGATSTLTVRSDIATKLRNVFNEFTEAQSRTWGEFISKEKDVFGSIRNTRVWQGATQRVTNIRNIAVNAYDSVTNGINSIGNGITRINNSISNSQIATKIGQVGTKVSQTTESVLNSIANSRVVGGIQRMNTAIYNTTESIINSLRSAPTTISTQATKIANAISETRAATSVANFGNSITRGTRAVVSPLVRLVSSTTSNVGQLASRVYGGFQNSRFGFNAVGNSVKSVAQRANASVGRSVVGRASQSIASKGITQMVGKAVKGGGPAALAGIAVDAANILGQHFGVIDKGGNTARALNVVGDTLGYAATGAMIGSFIPVIGNAVGGLIGGAIGLTKSLSDNFGKEIKSFFVGKDNMSMADVAEQQYEQSKFGMDVIQTSIEQDPTGEHLKLLAAQATVKMHDLLVSIWYRLNGLQSNGEKADRGLLGGLANAAKFVVGGTIGGVASTVVSVASGSVQEPTRALPQSSAVVQEENPTETSTKDYELENRAYQSTIDILEILKSNVAVKPEVEPIQANNTNIRSYRYNRSAMNGTANYSNYMYGRNAMGNVSVANVGNGLYPTIAQDTTSIGVKKSDAVQPNVMSVPVVGAPMVVAPSYEVKIGGDKPLDVNLNVSGTIKLDASAFGGKKVDININQLLEDNAVKSKIIDIIMTEFSKVNGKTAKDTAFSKTRNMLLGMSQMP